MRNKMKRCICAEHTLSVQILVSERKESSLYMIWCRRTNSRACIVSDKSIWNRYISCDIQLKFCEKSSNNIFNNLSFAVSLKFVGSIVILQKKNIPSIAKYILQCNHLHVFFIHRRNLKPLRSWRIANLLFPPYAQRATNKTYDVNSTKNSEEKWVKHNSNVRII